MDPKSIAQHSGPGGPFGAVVVKDGRVIGRGRNQVTSTNDSTAHAEMNAIRDACKFLNSYQLEDYVIYTTSEPCPMCLGAIYWVRLSMINYACSRSDVATIHFDDEHIYRELSAPLADRAIPIKQPERDKALVLFKQWQEKEDRITY